MRRWGNRLVVLVAAAAAVYAGVFAVRSAPGGHPTTIGAVQAAEATLSAQTVAFGHDRVITRITSSGLACFKAMHGSSTVARSCFGALAPDAIVYVASRFAVAGRAGPDVRAVIVHLTKKGTVWAQLRRGAFYAAIPAGHRATRVVKVLPGGVRTSFAVKD